LKRHYTKRRTRLAFQNKNSQLLDEQTNSIFN
jgi:hypothetical protein